MARTGRPPAQETASRSRPSRAISSLKAFAWLLLVLAILQRYVVRMGESPQDVDVATAGLLILALAARVIAWRLASSRRGERPTNSPLPATVDTGPPVLHNLRQPPISTKTEHDNDQ